MAEPTVPDLEKVHTLAPQMALAACSVAIGLSVLAAWVLGVDSLSRVFSGMIDMKPNAALLFVVAGFALSLIRPYRDVSRLAVGLSVFVALIGGLTLVEYLTSVNLGIDQLLFREPPNRFGSLAPGRMHPTTAFDFLLLGLASALLAANREHRAAQSMVLFSAFLAGATLVGYLYGVRSFVGLAVFRQMALHTTLGLLILSIGLLLARPRHGLMVPITDHGPSGVMARILLPFAMLMPIVISGLAIGANHIGVFDQHHASAVLVTIVTAVFVAGIWRSAQLLYVMDQERRRAHSERIDGDRKFRFLAESMPQIVWISGSDGQVGYLNERWFEYTGDDNSPPWDLLSVVHPDDHSRYLGRWQQAFHSGSNFQGEFRYRRHDHSYRWHLVHGLPIRDQSGRVIQWFGTATDIHDQRQAGEQRYRSLVEATAAIVWNTPSSGNFETEQPGWSTFTGQTYEQLKGRGWLDAIHIDDRRNTSRVWSDAVERRAVYQVQHRIRRHDGIHRHMSARAVPIVDDDGSIREWIGVHTDIDDQQRAVEALEAAKDAAEAATRAKAEFLANMSHEIRTPMNGVLGMTELALGTDLSPRQQEYLGLVKSSAEALLTVIDDILDFSKIEAGKLELHPTPFDPRDVLTDTLRCLAARAHAKGLELACRIAPNVPDILLGDHGRLRQVLVNLVGNAIKFTDHGEVVVTLEAHPPNPAAPTTLRVSVADTGIGILPEKRERIFAAFEQADGSTTRKYGGTGLGLTISTRLIELMNGRIWVEANPIGGSIFQFTAEVEVGSTTDSPRIADNPASLRGLRILIVDDNRTNRMILEEILSQSGCRVVAVENGPLALHAIDHAAACAEPYAVALLDRMMPMMDGCELARQIRARAQHPPIHLLMLTSDGSDDQLPFSEQIVDRRLAKPIRQSELIAAIIDLIDSKDRPSMPARQTNQITTPSGPRLRVLLAEDHPINQKVAVRMLELQGHEMTVAANGRLALEAYLDCPPFDVILMDIQMPEMDGLKATAAIREHELRRGRRVPIIALTAHAMAGDRERFLKAGFDDYLAKPIHAAAVAGILKRITGQVPSLASDPLPPPDDPPAFELAAALRRVDGDEKFLDEIFVLFLNYFPEFLCDACLAFDTGNATALARLGHTLAGAADHLAANRIVAAAQNLETLANSGDLSSAGEAIDSIAREFDRFRRATHNLALVPRTRAALNIQVSPEPVA